MVHGRRNGLCTRTYPGGKEVEEHYLNGMKIDLKKAIPAGPAEGPAYELLQSRHPWYLFMLEAFGYDGSYMENYLDTLELVLESFTFSLVDFDQYYEQALDSLSSTPYDSMVQYSNTLTGSIGMRRMKDDELRLAVIDYYRLEGASTFSILGSSYPNYIKDMVAQEISETDLEAFCNDLEDTLSMLGSVNPEDDFFVDTADSRFFIALTSFLDIKKSQPVQKKSTPVRESLSNIGLQWKNVQTSGWPENGQATPSEVAGVAISGLLGNLLEGDYLRKVVYDAYRGGLGLSGLPTTGTDYLSGPSATSATLGGYVIEDGGAEVTDRGIAWAGHYNPTMEDNAEASGSGTGRFTVTVDGLTEGNTYFARSYATNSTGTAYGNCISFEARSTVGTSPPFAASSKLNLYPNPASEMVQLMITDPPEGMFEVVLLDMGGRTVYRQSSLAAQGSPLNIQVDLAGIAEGVYHCQLVENGILVAGRALVIMH